MSFCCSNFSGPDHAVVVEARLKVQGQDPDRVLAQVTGDDPGGQGLIVVKSELLVHSYMLG